MDFETLAANFKAKRPTKEVPVLVFGGCIKIVLMGAADAQRFSNDWRTASSDISSKSTVAPNPEITFRLYEKVDDDGRPLGCMPDDMEAYAVWCREVVKCGTVDDEGRPLFVGEEGERILRLVDSETLIELQMEIFLFNEILRPKEEEAKKPASGEKS